MLERSEIVVKRGQDKVLRVQKDDEKQVEAFTYTFALVELFLFLHYRSLTLCYYRFCFQTFHDDFVYIKVSSGENLQQTSSLML